MVTEKASLLIHFDCRVLIHFVYGSRAVVLKLWSVDHTTKSGPRGYNTIVNIIVDEL